MFAAIDGSTVFPSHFTYMVSDVITALMDNNPYFPSAVVKFHVNLTPPKSYDLQLADAQFRQGQGIYVIYRENPLRPKENFYYIGSTLDEGHRARLRKILSHAIGYLGVNPGDNVLPVSRFLRDDCNKNLENIRTIFIPLNMPEDDIREMEIAIIKHMKSIHGHLVKNKSLTKSITRQKVREIEPALTGLW